MRILYISNPNSPLTRIWVEWFSNRGHEVSLISDTPKQGDWPNIKIFDLPAKFNVRIVRFLIWEKWTRQIVKRWKPDILHAHRVSSAGWLGAFSKFHPFVVTAWGNDLLVQPDDSPIARILAHFVMQKADLITADSKELLSKAIFYGANPNLCKIITWGVDLNLYYPGNASNLRREIGIGDGPIVFSPRGVRDLYNQDIVIEAVPLVLHALPRAIFLMRDFMVDENYKSRLLKRIEELGIKDSIYWLPYQSAERYADFFRLSDVVVSIPSTDSNPVTVIEALACGIPVIVSDLRSTREIINNYVNGIIIPIRDIKALAHAIIELVNNPQLRDKFSQYNIQWVNENANRENEMKKMESLYLNIHK